MAAYQLDSSNRGRTCLPVTLEWSGRARKTSALLDSGAEESFLDATITLNGQRLGRITRATRPLKMRISGNHQEEISLLIIDTTHSPVVLGHPWMVKHRPQVDWARHEILGWDPSCSSRCLRKAHAPVVTPQREESPNLAKVPREYHDLGGSSVRAGLLASPHTDRTTQTSSSSREQPPRGGASSPCLAQRGKPWRST